MEDVRIGIGRSSWTGSVEGVVPVPAETPEQLIELLASGSVDALVRGGLGAREVMDRLRERFGCRGCLIGRQLVAQVTLLFLGERCGRTQNRYEPFHCVVHL